MNIDAVPMFTFYHPLNNKAMEEALHHLPLQARSEMGTTASFKDILAQLLLSGKTDSSAQLQLLNVLKNSAVFKQMGSFANELKQLIVLLSSLEGAEDFVQIAQRFLMKPGEDDGTALKTKIASSGLLFEANIAQMLETDDARNELLARQWRNDLKAQLLLLSTKVAHLPESVRHEVQQLIDRLLFKIDYYQLLSSLSMGTALFVPYDFGHLKEGEMFIKRGDDDAVYCDIRLDLKQFGTLRVMLSLERKRHLAIHFHCETEALRSLLADGSQEFKAMLYSSGMVAESVRFFVGLPKEEEHYASFGDRHSAGFEYKA